MAKVLTKTDQKKIIEDLACELEGLASKLRKDGEVVDFSIDTMPKYLTSFDSLRRRRKTKLGTVKTYFVGNGRGSFKLTIDMVED